MLASGSAANLFIVRSGLEKNCPPEGSTLLRHMRSFIPLHAMLRIDSSKAHLSRGLACCESGCSYRNAEVFHHPGKFVLTSVIWEGVTRYN